MLMKDKWKREILRKNVEAWKKISLRVVAESRTVKRNMMCTNGIKCKSICTVLKILK